MTLLRFRSIVLACLLGIALYLAVVLLERLTLRWSPSTSG